MTLIAMRKRRAADTTAPTISSISSTAGVGVSWTTDEPADSQVEYGGGGGTAYATVVAADNPIAYWRMGEASGYPQDSSGNDHHVTATYGTPTYSQTGALTGDSDTAIEFHRTTDAYKVPYTEFQLGDTWTVEAWLKRDDLDSASFYFYWGNRPGSGDGWMLGFNASGQVYLYVYYGGGASSQTIYASTETFEDTDWHHIVVTKSGSTTTAYGDGEVLTKYTGSNYTLSSSYTSDWGIGNAGYVQGSASFDGLIDELAVYSTALSAATIADHYSAGLASGGTDYETTLNPILTTTHNVSIPSLTAGWTFRVKSRDAAGNLATSTDQVVGAVVSGTFQDIVDNASAGATVNLTGLTFSAGGTIDKALTIIGGTLQVPLNTKAITITADNVTLQGMTILGSQTNNYDGDETGIYIYSSRSGITITDCTVGNFGFAGMWLDSVANLTISGCTVYNCAYTGIALLSPNGGTVEDCYIHHIGYGYTIGGTGFPNNNAYAIVFTAQRTITTMARDVVVQNNVIEDVPTWHGIDSHGGIDLTIAGNTIRRTSRPIFITGHDDSGTVYGSTNVAVTGNYVPSPSPVTYNLRAIFFTATYTCSATGNYISSAWPITGDYPANPADNRVDNYGTNTGLVVSGNVLTA